MLSLNPRLHLPLGRQLQGLIACLKHLADTVHPMRTPSMHWELPSSTVSPSEFVEPNTCVAKGVSPSGSSLLDCKKTSSKTSSTDRRQQGHRPSKCRCQPSHQSCWSAMGLLRESAARGAMFMRQQQCVSGDSAWLPPFTKVTWLEGNSGILLFLIRVT